MRQKPRAAAQKKRTVMSDINLFAAARAKKSLGQHFLRDERAVQRIVDLLRVEKGDNIMEIGPGPGALTALLRPLPWKRLLLLEKDEHYAAEHAARPLPNLEVEAADALAYPWEKLEEPWKIAGNLPYNVASPLIWDIVSRLPHLARAVFMVQKEVGDRLTASPSGKDYGALSVWVQSFTVTKKGFVIGPSAFSPPPKVDSSVVVFTPLPKEKRPAKAEELSRLIKICFQQRRKQIQGILRRAMPSRFSVEVLKSLGIDPAQRPENLSVEQFQLLAEALFHEKIAGARADTLDDKREMCTKEKNASASPPSPLPQAERSSL